jgi:hypothetical protein
MRRGIVALFLLALCASAADKRADVKILEFSAHRNNGEVVIDGRYSVTAGKPVSQVSLTFDFLAEGHSSVATKQFTVDEPTLEPGDEGVFHLSASAPPRAVEVKVRAYRGGSLEIKLENAGPHPIGD